MVPFLLSPCKAQLLRVLGQVRLSSLGEELLYSEDPERKVLQRQHDALTTLLARVPPA
jgi:hypothetical protein